MGPRRAVANAARITQDARVPHGNPAKGNIGLIYRRRREPLERWLTSAASKITTNGSSDLLEMITFGEMFGDELIGG